MTWVKLTLPPRERARWLLMTTRLSISSLAGTARTLVAVGTWRLDSMLVTTRAEAPRSGLTSLSLSGPGDFLAGASRVIGVGVSPPCWPSATLADGSGALAAGFAGAALALAAGAGSGSGVAAGADWAALAGVAAGCGAGAADCCG